MAITLGQIAQSKRYNHSQEQIYKRNAAKINIRTWLRKNYKLFLLKNLVAFELFLEKIQAQWPNQWTPLEWTKIVKSAIDSIYGDPMKVRPFSIPFFNPTNHDIVIAPLGLLGLDQKVISTIPPGGIVTIPIAYTRGGRNGPFSTVAPQLKPMPNIKPDQLLDLSACSYKEWITYDELSYSSCCNRQVVWSDLLEKQICDKCKKSVNFKS